MKSQFIAGEWIEGAGEPFSSRNPATGETAWTGRGASGDDVNRAVTAARKAFVDWSGQPLSRRIDVLSAFAAQLKQRKADLVEIICRETGKPRWESGTEVDAMIGKVAISIDAHEKRRHETANETAGVTSATRYKPYGVVAVLGPFNFPGHLPNGHIVPALLAGNTVVFKPSELTPAVGAFTIEQWHAAGLPAGVLNLVQGGRETGRALADHAEIDGLFFTGSVAAGLALHRSFADRPQKILALELGGNNPLVVWDAGDLDAAAHIVVQSAYITAGQR